MNVASVDASTYAQGSDIVLGVPLGSSSLSKMFGRVIVIAVLVAIYRVLIFIYNLLKGEYEGTGRDGAAVMWAAMTSLLMELSIPACGYCGAVYSNRQLMCCFCTCNLFNAVVTLAGLIRLQIYFSGSPEQCNVEQRQQDRIICQEWAANGEEKRFMLISGLIIACLGSLGFWFGNTLFNRLSHGPVLLTPPLMPLVGEVISLRTNELTTASVATELTTAHVRPGEGRPSEPAAATRSTVV